MRARGRDRLEMPLDQLAHAPILVLKLGGETREILAGQEGACPGAIAFAFGLGTDAPAEESQILLLVKLVECLGDVFDLVLGHSLAVLP